VEDGGPGLTAEAAEHAFDPFYCGRSAGRGRGLGLPTAWQFVRQNGGELRYAPAPDGPTRFVVSLKRAIGHERLTLRSA
jgi:two-component system, NtrC family, sensor kinase